MSQAEDATIGSAAARRTPITVFVSDPTAEAERAAKAMLVAGYVVVDVPLSMLVARVAVQHPRVILVDADGEGALEVIARIRELPGAEDIHVLLLAVPGGAIGSQEEALAYEASGLFVRPVDVPDLVRRVGELAGTGAAAGLDRAREPRPPTSSRTPSVHAVAETMSRSASGRPPASERPASLRSYALSPPLSTELRELLAEAEQRAAQDDGFDSIVPSPEDELEAILPAELLAALDEPLEEEDDDEGALPRRPSSVAAPESSPSQPTSSPGQPITHSGTHSGSTGPEPSTGGNSESEGVSVTGPSPGNMQSATVPPPTRAAPQPAFEEGAFPAVVARHDAIRVLARAVAGHLSGSFCFAVQSCERRVVLREGDIATAVSNAEDESLLSFLASRGDLPRETVRRLSATFPLYGRHAGAALVARGYLRQDQLWPTLRAHAEWILGRTLQSEGATLVVEAQPPGRVQSEPSVFGGSPGAAVLVEVVRRVVPPEDAAERMGGPGSRIGPGPGSRLLGECALAPAELAQIQSVGGHSVGEALDVTPDGDLAPLLYALSQLGVIEVLRAVGDALPVDPERDPAGVAALDAEAIRERVRARLQLVDDGDYFAVLGVTRDATGYEVRRAFLELRRAFEPSRVLTSETADLADDMRKITFVLEEAYEILKDAARRERYRRAIEATPGA
jgi:hypothetical protein